VPAPAKNPQTPTLSKVDPILLYLIGVAVGAENGLTQGFHHKIVNHNQRSYCATKEGGVLTITVSVDDFIRKNAEIEVRKARELVNLKQHLYDSLKTQVDATSDSYEYHKEELTRIDKKDVTQRAKQETVIESWKLTLAEIQPRLLALKTELDEATKQFEDAKKVVIDNPEVLTFDLNNLPF